MNHIGSILILLFVSIHLPFSTQSGKANRFQKSKTALYFESLGLVNVAEMDETISVKLMYAHPDNFTGRTLYEDLSEAYLHPDAAKAFVAAQKILKKHCPSYTLIIYDAARPMSIQQKMWETVRGTSKNIYVSNPAHGGGLHNYGLAVDVSILDEWGNPLPMGT
ncbi:D-alanyl-D-alanine dipeptidase, partial [termite gut metagenome]